MFYPFAIFKSSQTRQFSKLLLLAAGAVCMFCVILQQALAFVYRENDIVNILAISFAPTLKNLQLTFDFFKNALLASSYPLK